MDDGVEFVLIRHLPTSGNNLRQYIGWTDEAILPSEVEAFQYAPHTVYGSDLQRARQTATILFPQAIYDSDSAFRECNFGEFEGKTYAQLEHNIAYRQWVTNPLNIAPPNGETLHQVEERVVNAFSNLPPGARVILHGGPIRLLLTWFVPHPRAFWEWEVPHGSQHRLVWESIVGWKEGERCTSYSVERLTESDNTSDPN